MTAGTIASNFLDQEAQALLTRLSRVKPFALHETMVPAAALVPRAQTAIERVLLRGRFQLADQVKQYLVWLRGPGQQESPAEQQRRFTMIRLQFNNVLSQFDLFTEVITQRSEHETGVWLAGLDVVAADALRLPDEYFEAPQVICYLDRGPGAAIRRARTRLPGGAENPVAIVRVPRERMVGHGIASSLVHEVGHQGAALLALVESLRPAIQAAQRDGGPQEAEAWRSWERWISEVVADYWSVGKLGIGSTLGLMGVVSLPRWFVFRPSGDDPHPIPFIRVLLSCAIGDALYPHPQWAALGRTWDALYPRNAVTDEHRRLLDGLEASIPDFVELLVSHRPPALRGRSLQDVMPVQERRPERLDALASMWRLAPAAMVDASPSLVFAVLGQARAGGYLKPATESRLLGELLTQWALRSTLDMSAVCAKQVVRPLARLAS